MTYQAIVLDMDGTLVNTEALWKQAERNWLASYERAYDPVKHAQFLGLSVNDFVPAVQDVYDLTHVDSTILIDKLESHVRGLLETQTRPQVGTIELIDFIMDKQIPCAIASNSSHEMIQTTLKNQRWADAISKRYSADDVPRAKPAPDLYRHVAKELNVDPKHCIAVEDSLTGVKAAVSAGMICLAVPESELSDRETYQAVTPHVFETLHDVLTFIQLYF